MTSTTDTTTTTSAAPVETSDEWAAKIARLRSRKPAEKWVTIPDDDAVHDVETARMALYRARTRARDNAPADGLSQAELDAFVDHDETVVAALADLETKIAVAQAAEVVFHLRALPPDVYDNLASEFPPNEEQESVGLTYDVEAYVPALIARSSVKPLTAEQVAGLIYPHEEEIDGETVTVPAPFNQGDVTALVQMCRDLNEKPRMLLGKGSRPTPN